MSLVLLALILLSFPPLALSQAEYRIYEKHPRLLLEERQINRLRKDVERESARWRQLNKLIENDAAFPEEPLVQAIRFQAALDQAAGEEAKQWVLQRSISAEGFTNADELRLAAIVFDWCYELFSADERETAARALGKAARSTLSSPSAAIDSLRSAVLAAASAAGDWDGSEPALKTFFERHWEPEILPALLRGELTDRGFALIAVMEICHVIRRNLERDLWREAMEVFEPLARLQMLGYYPQPLETEEGLFRWPALPSTVELDLVRESTLRRIGEMLLVAYETTWGDYPFLQGWLRHDAFSLNTPLGAPYEFLWVNPYLPGLSYFSAPIFAHDELGGRLFARAGWQDEDLWVGYLDGEMQIFADGERHIIRREDQQPPLILSDTAVVFGSLPLSFRLKMPEGRRIFIVGLGDGQPYRVKINRSRFEIHEAGRGGILLLENDPEEKKPLLNFKKRIRIEVRPAPKDGPSLK